MTHCGSYPGSTFHNPQQIPIPHSWVWVSPGYGYGYARRYPRVYPCKALVSRVSTAPAASLPQLFVFFVTHLFMCYISVSSSSSLILLSFEVSCLLPCNLSLSPIYFIRLPCSMSGRMVLLATQLLACLAEFN